jgi:hypothetical protein
VRTGCATTVAEFVSCLLYADPFANTQKQIPEPSTWSIVRFSSSAIVGAKPMRPYLCVAAYLLGCCAAYQGQVNIEHEHDKPRNVDRATGSEHLSHIVQSKKASNSSSLLRTRINGTHRLDCLPPRLPPACGGSSPSPAARLSKRFWSPPSTNNCSLSSCICWHLNSEL